MPDDTRTYTVSYDRDLGPILKNLARDTEQASRAIDGYGQTVRHTAEAQARSGDIYRTALRTTKQRIRETQTRDERVHASRGDELSLPSAGNAFLTVSLLNQLIHAFPPLRAIQGGVTSVTALAGFFTIVKKYLDDPELLKLPTKDVQSIVTTTLDWLDTILTGASSLAGLAPLASSGLLSSAATASLLTSIGAIGAAAASPLLAASVGVAILAYIAKNISDKEKARQRESAALAEERRRTAPQHTKMKLEDYALGRENSLRTAYESLRLSNQSIVNLTGKNVDDLLKNLQGLSPRALEAYFQSLREGRGEIEQLSQTQLAHIDLIEQLVVTYRALAVESDAARDAASEYADHLRPVDVIFETLAVHAGELTSQFVEQREALQRQTQATEAQAQAARNAAAATTAQAVATERANTGEVARTQTLLRTTQHTREATEQVSDATERLTELTGTLVTTDAGLATHSEHVGDVTEAYRELSAQIGDTIGDVLAGAGSFKEAWESLRRGVLDIVKHLGRQLLDSLLGSVRSAPAWAPEPRTESNSGNKFSTISEIKISLNSI